MFYCVSGKSGFGVYTDYNKALRNSEFISRPVIKSFDTFFKAAREAIDNYNSYYDGEDFDAYFYDNPSAIRPNWIFYKKEIVKHNNQN